MSNSKIRTPASSPRELAPATLTGSLTEVLKLMLKERRKLMQRLKLMNGAEEAPLLKPLHRALLVLGQHLRHHLRDAEALGDRLGLP